MLLAAHTPPLDYSVPWNISFEDRLASFCARPLRVAYLYEAPDTSTFRYRVFNMVDALNASDTGISASWFVLADMPRMDRVLDRADALILCRTRFGPDVDRLLSRAATRKIPVLFDVDDLVFDPQYISLIIDALDQAIAAERIWDMWFAYVGRMAATLRCCPRAITTNAYLADKISAANPGIITNVVPNFLNRLQQETSQAIWNAKLESGFDRDDTLHIGYFSGTPSHNRDFQVAAPAIAQILDNVPNAKLRIVGFLDLKEPLASYRDRIEFFPLQDFPNLQRLIGEVEISISPLQNNLFTNCKSELKYFEAAIVGTLTIASPTFTFQQAIQDGKNGYLSCAHEWESKLAAAIDLVHDTEHYAALAKRAYQHALSTYHWQRYAQQIKSAIFEDSSSLTLAARTAS